MKKVAAILVLFLVTTGAFAQDSDFLELVKTGTAEQIQAAINSGADVNARDEDNVSALLLAAEYNKNPDVIRTLRNAGAHFWPDIFDALFAAAIGGRKGIRAIKTFGDRVIPILERWVPWSFAGLLVLAWLVVDVAIPRFKKRSRFRDRIGRP